MKRVCGALLGLLFVALSAPAQVNVQGSGIQIGGFVAALCGRNVVMPSDANYTLTPSEFNCNSLNVTSSVSLTATRNVIAPNNLGQQFTVTNATTGAQDIEIIGTGGGGAMIPNGSTCVVNNPTGTSYVLASCTGGGGGGSPGGATYAMQYNGGSSTFSGASPFFEYTQTPRPALATLLENLHYCATQACNIVFFGDSFTACDFTNCGVGPNTSTNRVPEQVRLDLQARYGSNGTGVVPVSVGYPLGAGSPQLNSEAWSCTGTVDFSTGTLGPSQTLGQAQNALLHLHNGAVCTFNDVRAIPWSGTLQTYCMTNASSGSLAVSIDSGAVTGTACGSTTGSATAHVVSLSDATYSTHSVSYTSTGDSYLFAAQGINGSSGVSVSMIAFGAATASMFGVTPSSQMAFTDLIPGGTQVAVLAFLTNDVNFGEGASNFATYLTSIANHETGLSQATGAPSVLLDISPVDSIITGSTGPYVAAALPLCVSLNIACLNEQDRWGTTYSASPLFLWDQVHAPGSHPSDAGDLDRASMVEFALNDLQSPVRNGTIYLTQYNNANPVGNTLVPVYCTLCNVGSSFEYGLGQGPAQTFVEAWSNGAFNDSFGLYLGSAPNSGYSNSNVYFTSTGETLRSGASYGFSSSSSNAGTGNTARTALTDTQISRLGPGLFSLDTTTIGDSLGSLKLVNLGGLATHPSGSCPMSGYWQFTMDAYMSECNAGTWQSFALGAGGGTVTNIATSGPITGGPITSTGTIACSTCVTSAASLTSNAVILGGGSQAVTALASANNEILGTDGSGVPAWRTALPSGVTSASASSFTFNLGSTGTFALNKSGVGNVFTMTMSGSPVQLLLAGITTSYFLNANGDGTQPGSLGLYGNTTAPTVAPANAIALLGPNSASFTGYYLQFGTTSPSANQVMLVGAPVSGVAPVTFGTVGNASLTNSATTVHGATCTLGSSCLATLPLSCQPGVGDGLNAIPAGTYLTTTCRNETGGTWTLTAIRCYSDNNGSSTCNATNGAGTGLLTGAVTATNSYANGTQSGTTTIASGDYLKITFVADGTSKQIGIDVAGTY